MYNQQYKTGIGRYEVPIDDMPGGAGSWASVEAAAQYDHATY